MTVEVEFPAGVVDAVVIAYADGGEALKVGVAVVVSPFVEVVDLAVIDWYLTVREAARGVEGLYCPSLGGGGQSAGPPHVEHLGGAAPSAGGLAHPALVEAVEEGVMVDDDNDFGDAPVEGGGAGDEGDQRGGVGAFPPPTLP